MKDRKYTIQDLVQAVREYNYAVETWKEAARVLDTRRALVDELEQNEAKAKDRVDHHESVIRRIMKDME